MLENQEIDYSKLSKIIKNLKMSFEYSLENIENLEYELKQENCIDSETLELNISELVKDNKSVRDYGESDNMLKENIEELKPILNILKSLESEY
jgi:fatty acid-binding protein DegV